MWLCFGALLPWWHCVFVAVCVSARACVCVCVCVRSIRKPGWKRRQDCWEIRPPRPACNCSRHKPPLPNPPHAVQRQKSNAKQPLLRPPAVSVSCCSWQVSRSHQEVTSSRHREPRNSSSRCKRWYASRGPAKRSTRLAWQTCRALKDTLRRQKRH